MIYIKPSILLTGLSNSFEYWVTANTQLLIWPANALQDLTEPSFEANDNKDEVGIGKDK